MLRGVEGDKGGWGGSAVEGGGGVEGSIMVRGAWRETIPEVREGGWGLVMPQRVTS